MMSDAMVGISSFAAFARNELLAERLVSKSVLTSCFDLA